MQLSLELSKIMILDWPKCHARAEQPPAPGSVENLPPLFEPDPVDASRPVKNKALLALYRAMDMGA